MRKQGAAAILFLLIAVVSLPAAVPRPEDVLGFRIGEDRRLADRLQIIEYFRLLDEASGRVQVEELGKTTMGHPFIAAVITSEANLAELERYRGIQQRLADPRTVTEVEAEEMIAAGRAVVMINCSIHASEIGASQMALELAWELASGSDPATRRILDNVILLLIPMHNPDGIQIVADWYRKNLGTPYEGGRLPWLYNKYVGHDNNRDWYMFTQAESRLTLRLHNAWHPHIVLDMHQMGKEGARLFVPPYVDPFEPNVDPIIVQQSSAMGTFIASELTARGLSGVIHSNGFDAWTPARAYHHYHGGIRILTEAASVDVATPVTVPAPDLEPDVRTPSVRLPLPWMGGAWSLRDIVDYDLAAAKAVLTHAASLRENWVRNFYRVQKKAVTPRESPFAFIVPAGQRDLPAAVQMLRALRMGGVEVHRARREFTADGMGYPAGTFVVFRSQPFGGFAKALLEKQAYPEIRAFPGGPLKTPYDAVAHTLPLLMGVEVAAAGKRFDVEAEDLDEIALPPGTVDGSGGFGFAWADTSGQGFIALNRLIGRGCQVLRAAEPFQIEGFQYAAGTMVVLSRPGLENELKALAGDLCVRFTSLPADPGIPSLPLSPVRLGLYRSWTASMDEGWTRWVLEQYEFPFVSLTDADIRSGDLSRSFDAIILPDMEEKAIVEGLPEGSAPSEYTGGIGEVGVHNLHDFVAQGGTLIAMDSAADFCLNRLHLAVENRAAGLDRKDFFIPGSILSGLVDAGHPLGFGFERDVALMFRSSPLLVPREGRSVVSYPSGSLLSGWVNGEEHLAGTSALVDVPCGRGRVVLIAFPALFRGQAQGTFRFLFNAVYYSLSKPG